MNAVNQPVEPNTEVVGMNRMGARGAAQERQLTDASSERELICPAELPVSWPQHVTAAPCGTKSDQVLLVAARPKSL